MSGDPYKCGCGHAMKKHEDDLGACRIPGCKCPHWSQQFSDDHLRRTPRVAVDLHGPRQS